MPDDDRTTTGLFLCPVRPEVGPPDRRGSPPFLTVEGSRPLVEACLGQGEVVVTMGSEPRDVPTCGVGSANDDNRHSLA